MLLKNRRLLSETLRRCHFSHRCVYLIYIELSLSSGIKVLVHLMCDYAWSSSFDNICFFPERPQKGKGKGVDFGPSYVFSLIRNHLI